MKNNSQEVGVVESSVTYSTIPQKSAEAEKPGYSKNTVPVKASIRELTQSTEKNEIELKNLAKKTEQDFKDLLANFRVFETKMNNQNSFLVSFVAGILLITFMLISLDYFKFAGERYEKFVDKTSEIKSGYYSKSEVDTMMENFKNCIWSNGLKNCLK